MPTSDTKAKQSYERYKSSLKDQPREDTGMLDQLLDKLYDNTIGMAGRWRNIPERNTATTRQSDKYPGNVATGSWEKSMTKPSGYAEGGIVERSVKQGSYKEYERFPLRPLEGGESVPLKDGSKATEYTVTIPTTRNDEWITAPSIWMTPSGARRFEDADVRRLVKQYEDRTGKAFPRHKSSDEAGAAAEKRTSAGGIKSGPLAKDKSVAKKKKYNVGGMVKGTDKMAYAGGGMANDKKRAPKTSKRPVASNKRGQRGR